MTNESRMQVLVVDDDPANLQLIRRVLESAFDVTCTASPREALDLMQQRSFHVVCSDYRMPGMNGITLLARVLELSEPPGVVLITAYPEQREVEEVRVRGDYAVVTKPYDSAALLAMVRQLATRVDQRRRFPSSRSQPPRATTGG